MRYQPEHKSRTRRRILDAAAALFRRQGYQGVGIDRIMEAAALTRGGFYAHFPSKAALFNEVLGRESDFLRRLRASEDARDVIAGYLDPDNREQIAKGCDLASLTNDVPRRGREARDVFARQVGRLAAEFEAHVPEDAPDRRARSLEALALCVGGISLARGIGDPRLAREILAVCRERACAAVAGR